MKSMAVFSRIRRSLPSLLALMLAGAWLANLAQPLQVRAQADDPTPPSDTVKLIFIHHSTGENWLTDDYGNLGRVLGENNYFVSDTNYGWGPDGIGDRTDIPNWPEWFRSDNTPIYMDALFSENGQNSNYTRTLSDPGGENEIVMFKSCFPNSALAGAPNDPPTPGYDYTVGNAKFVYNEILQYFASRPDKLFVVITAPPLSDPEYAANARAFNLWLMQDWLVENNYPYSNVAVFDFYNVLTGSDAHHRFANGQIEHIVGSKNTLDYPSGDDHPSEVGSQKATEEFVPLLNIFYHRWKASLEAQAPIQTEPTAAPEATALPEPVEQPVEESSPQVAVKLEGLIDDFEAGAPSGSDGWAANWDTATETTITCSPEVGVAYNGNGALQVDFNVAAASWATCTLFYSTIQDWQATQGLAFNLHTGQPGLTFDVDVYGGTLDNMETYAFTLVSPPEAETGWAGVFLTWDQLLRVAWEENAGAPLDPSRVIGLGFGLGAPAEAAAGGEFWVDDLRLASLATSETGLPVVQAPAETVLEPTQALATETESEQATPETQPQAEPEKSSQPGLCPGSAALIFGVLGVALWSRRVRV